MSSRVEQITRIRRAIDVFLKLTSEKRTAEEVALAVALDGLAWAVREIPAYISPKFSGDDASISRRTASELAEFANVYRRDRERIAEIFPHLGLYSLVEPADSTDVETVIRDAIDDMVDIRRDLESVMSVWDEVGEAEALWEMRFSFESHWGNHLRGLQIYLFHRLSPLYEAGW